MEYGRRMRSTWPPRFQGTRDLKFSIAEQEAIRDAEAAFGYRPQQIPRVRPRVRVLPWLLGSTLAVWFAFSLIAPIAQVVEHGISSLAFVPDAQRPPSSMVPREASSDSSSHNPRPSPQLMESSSPDADARPEPSSVGFVIERSIDGPGAAAPQPFDEALNRIQTATSDKRATNRQEAEPASCPEGQSVASIAYVNAPDDHIYRVVYCKPKSEGNSRRGTLHTDPEGHVHDPASLQHSSEVTEPQSLRSENSPQSSSVSVEPRWLSFEPSHADMFSGADARDGKPFSTQGPVSSAGSGRAVKKRSLLRRALGGVGGPVLSAVRSVAASVRGEIRGD